MGRTGLALLVSLPLSAPLLASGAAPSGPGPLQHEALARAWLEERGLDPQASQAQELELGTVLERCFAKVRLGGIELLVPHSALADGEDYVEVAEALQAVLRAQEAWLAWSPVEEQGELEEAFATVTDWLERWKPRDLRKLAAPAGPDLLATLAPDEEVLAALASLAERLAAPDDTEGPADDTGATGTGARMILFPRRAEFLGFACVVGLLREQHRPWFWVEGLVTWTEIDFDGTRALTFQLAPGNDPQAPPIGMKERNPLGLQEHVAQLAARSLLEALYGERMDPALAAGLANELVIDVYGEVDTRTDGDLRARETAAKSAFIPGAQEGGNAAFGAGDADTRWRAERGKDHFVRPLRVAQKRGAKQVPRERRHRAFALEDDEGVGEHVVLAPFLGPAGGGVAVPEAFRGDHQELLRSYRVAFLHWLRTEAAGKDSAARFARVLADLRAAGPAADATAAPDFPALLAEAYGAPLSSPEPSEQDLEGRFLLWLEKR